MTDNRFETAITSNPVEFSDEHYIKTIHEVKDGKIRKYVDGQIVIYAHDFYIRDRELFKALGAREAKRRHDIIRERQKMSEFWMWTLNGGIGSVCIFYGLFIFAERETWRRNDKYDTKYLDGYRDGFNAGQKKVWRQIGNATKGIK